MTVQQLLRELTRPNVDLESEVVVVLTHHELGQFGHARVWFAGVDVVTLPDGDGRSTTGERMVLEAATTEIL